MSLKKDNILYIKYVFPNPNNICNNKDHTYVALSNSDSMKFQL